ncbi:hypothetical protein XENTR_v10008972 [Xenopus tropicalis]|nr:hypothetical protein XENTR_v10008972 [Xenopus tropicalis]
MTSLPTSGGRNTQREREGWDLHCYCRILLVNHSYDHFLWEHENTRPALISAREQRGCLCSSDSNYIFKRPFEEMPLVVLCGFPCSGKSSRSQELQEHLEQSGRKVHIIGDHVLGVDRNAVYADSKKEKELRGSLRAAVERKLNKEEVVILDSPNYIKGYRYELFCLIKHVQTPHCLIHCITAPEISSTWNQNRDKNEQYNQEIFDALVQRFEFPDSRNRWDSPLFTVHKDEKLPLEQICNAIFHRKAPPPNQSTQMQPLSSTNFLHELDKTVLNAQKTSVPGDVIMVPGASEKVQLPRILSMSELRRLRQQFISYTKLHPNENISQLANMFVQYLNQSIH